MKNMEMLYEVADYVTEKTRHLSNEAFKSLMGVIFDIREMEHEDFDTCDSLLHLFAVAHGIHETIGDMENELDFIDLDDELPNELPFK